MISVLTTVLNGARYIEPCFATLAAQSLADWEWIIIDDGSTDDTVACIERLQARVGDDRIRLDVSGQRGRAGALNRAAELAAGEVVAILDVDDLWHAEKLRTQMHAWQGADGCFAIATGYRVFRGTRPPADATLQSPVAHYDITLNDLLYYNPLFHSSVLMARETARYSTTRSTMLDYELYLRTAARTDRHVRVLDAPLGYKRISDTQHFEGGVRLAYGSSGAWLAARYCLRRRRLVPLILNLLKPIYYLVPRRLAVGLRHHARR